MRLLVIGAGPIGLAAALGGVRRGFETVVLEQGEIGGSIRRWGPARFFSPLSMNVPSGVSTALPGDAILTGPEFVNGVLLPMAAGLDVRTGHRVLSVSRSGLSRGDYANHPIRAERPFRVLTADEEFEADAVLDASGVYGNPVPLAAPGLARFAGRILRTLEGIDHLAGSTVLLTGHGHSAANALVQLSQLPGTQVVWATRSLNRRPCVEVASDPLPERRATVRQANAFAMQPPAWLRVERRAAISRVAEDSVVLSGGRVLRVDNILALTGYRPDLSIASELALSIDPATEGAAGVARALSNVTDCLSIPTVTPADLESGEPGFYLAGSKSYGRARTFLLQSGYAQLETMLDRLRG